ncbi:unnamed protein product [Nyctereutes procyonoides]|uniref:Small ribosomal subunit protein mS26 n=1 Tax=Nyctereutes procyonoides TaxID=34880 RepID=A0A811ZTV0_NYCPR|nr:unnamed protein product [Nyctereutes procyonoides]
MSLGGEKKKKKKRTKVQEAMLGIKKGKKGQWLRQEAREQQQRQVEEEARQARKAQAWAQLKEQENLEARVEEALDSPPKSYNWAITREGLVVRPQHRARKGPVRTVPTQGPCVYGVGGLGLIWNRSVDAA